MKLFALLVVALAACGGKPSTTTTTTDTTATATLPDVPFDQLNHDQAIQFMKTKVLPTMEPIFKNHDAKKYAEFGCVTCHGERSREGHFDMPNDQLPKLNFADMSKFKKEDVEWMGKEVLPTMVKLLKVEPYSEQNPKGFGCLGCHTPAQ